MIFGISQRTTSGVMTVSISKYISSNLLYFILIQILGFVRFAVIKHESKKEHYVNEMKIKTKIAYVLSLEVIGRWKVIFGFRMTLVKEDRKDR